MTKAQVLNANTRHNSPSRNPRCGTRLLLRSPLRMSHAHYLSGSGTMSPASKSSKCVRNSFRQCIKRVSGVRRREMFWVLGKIVRRRIPDTRH